MQTVNVIIVGPQSLDKTAMAESVANALTARAMESVNFRFKVWSSNGPIDKDYLKGAKLECAG